MASIYLSYKNEDVELARALAKELEQLGHSVTYDALALAPGQNWRDVLLSALSNSDAVVAILTERALGSHFVMGEIGMARVVQQSFGKALLLPVIVGDISIPTVVSDLFTVRMQPDTAGIRAAASELVRAFTEYLDRSRRGFPRIFISHRHADVAVVQALVDLLTAAFVVEPRDLRCTSVHPYRLKVGDRTSDRLRAELQRAEAVLGIISPDVKASSYVLFELGASWGRAGITMPLLIRGATAADVPAPIGDLHTLSLANEAECHQLIDDLADVVTLPRQARQGSFIAQKVTDLVTYASQPISSSS
jgi:hypothetical protein